jgi:hypothetical protein
MQIMQLGGGRFLRTHLRELQLEFDTLTGKLSGIRFLKANSWAIQLLEYKSSN